MCLQDSTVEQSQCCLCWQGQIGFQFALAGEWGRRWAVTFWGQDPSSIVNWVTLLPPASMYIEEDFHVLAWVHKFLEPSSGFPVCRNTFGIKGQETSVGCHFVIRGPAKEIMKNVGMSGCILHLETFFGLVWLVFKPFVHYTWFCAASNWVRVSLILSKQPASGLCFVISGEELVCGNSEGSVNGRVYWRSVGLNVKLNSACWSYFLENFLSYVPIRGLCRMILSCANRFCACI